MDDFKVKLPLWLRLLYIISGILIIGFAVVIFINEFVASPFITNTLLLGIALILISVERILNGLFDKRHDKWFRIFNLVIGLLVLPIGITAIFVESILAEILLSILALAVLLLGIVSVVNGFEDKKKVNAYKLTIIFYGFILVSLAVSILILDTMLEERNLIVMLDVSILLLGFRRIMEGILDHRIFKQPQVQS
ncbi:MAG TPA: DUF308 domain-containing protein [Candidatus Bathyarchaeia archaeon]|nr:DUF308 domain-containing protein [Candidatus Bathyarchaeia archaeon]